MQVMYFKFGGVSIVIGMEHRVIEGHSTFHLVNTWSEIACGVVDVAAPPFFDRTILHSRNHFIELSPSAKRLKLILCALGARTSAYPIASMSW